VTFADWAPVVTAALAGIGGVGGLLIWLVKASAAGERAARSEALTVLKEAARENAIEAARNRDAAAAEGQKTRDALAAHTAAINSNTVTMAEFMRWRSGSGRSGQTAAVGRRDDDGAR